MLIWPLPRVRAFAESDTEESIWLAYVESIIIPAPDNEAPAPIVRKGVVESARFDLDVDADSSALTRTSAPSPEMESGLAAALIVPRAVIDEPASMLKVSLEARITSGAVRASLGEFKTRFSVFTSSAVPVAVVRLLPPTRRLSAFHEFRMPVLRFTAPPGAEIDPPEI